MGLEIDIMGLEIDKIYHIKEAKTISIIGMTLRPGYFGRSWETI